MIKIIDKDFTPYISAEEISKRINELGAEISKVYEGEKPLLVSVLNGSFIFTADLIRTIDTPIEVTFIRVASYDALKSSGKVREILGLKENVFGRDILILEDIVDTGTTLEHLMEAFQDLGTKSIKVATLLHKPEAQEKASKPDFVGFEIPNKFVVGFGLDYEGFGRELKEIYQLV
ncbi:hypoxanthine phosphoribosyltransferase [Marivirga tractuosa]|uniref:Hypoxanthine phosphoribosyltransferase n=1 Tax=Marivirga tractuosa (strain ATCC 23168 / DSM 4126 / NBRC 15989 / NCIMB 1408 / VKM B-1430 / H-43) TaxID=643867 RepID=E4TT92_MARTH|nr:hypoxanthine phosphoribosyltransferase [Marivirga tractuosa]ADR21922.1 hypoxanthine phosphoribosyltransferase [Marivirga tractuosa DSM 4126]BDD13619.1 hypoxanthine phosphoribosyltransferase [Marivirga tractuosa]